MAALNSGTRAPQVKLPLLSGGTFDLQQALQTGPVLLAFFKITCPVCQFTFPYIERIHKAYPKAQIVGVSQNDASQTAAFNREYGVTFPTTLDDTGSYPASNAYGLTNVPTLFLIAPDGQIELSSVGWSRADVQQVAQKLASGAAATALFQPKESVPDFKAG